MLISMNKKARNLRSGLFFFGISMRCTDLRFLKPQPLLEPHR
jgi:hypothetical protein